MFARKIWSGIGMKTAFRTELVAVLVVNLCCFVDPPFMSSVEGQVTFEDAADIYIGGIDILYLDQPVLLDTGATVLIEYQDRVTGQVVLSVKIDPGKATATTYLTDAGRRFQEWLWLSYLALFGVVAGLSVALGAAARLYTLARLEGAPLGGLSASMAPFSLLASAALAANVGSVPASSPVMWATFVIWPIAAVGTLVARAVGRGSHEGELAVARQGRTLAWIAGTGGLLGWFGYSLWFLSQFGWWQIP
jgi:hypothetical protein